METNFFVKNPLALMKEKNVAVNETSDEDLKAINGLKKNGPLVILEKEDVIVRKIIILGEEPTTKMSVHPEGDLNGKIVKVLSELMKKCVGTPMMVGHKIDGRAPWGRVFDAEVLQATHGFNGAVLKEAFWFMNDEEGANIVRKIDGGIWAEGSISYWFKEARCSICHTPMAASFFGRVSKCKHQIGQKDEATGQVCYWYPYKIEEVAETSYVFAGAYRKTKSMLSADKEQLKIEYSDDEMKAGIELEKYLVDAGLDLNKQTEEENLENKSTKTGMSPVIETTENQNAQEKTATDIPGEQAGEQTASGNNLNGSTIIPNGSTKITDEGYCAGSDMCNTNTDLTSCNPEECGKKNGETPGKSELNTDKSSSTIPPDRNTISETNVENLNGNDNNLSVPILENTESSTNTINRATSIKETEEKENREPGGLLFKDTQGYQIVLEIAKREGIEREEKEQLIIDALQGVGVLGGVGYEDAIVESFAILDEGGLGFWTCWGCHRVENRLSFTEEVKNCSACGIDMELMDKRMERGECLECKEEYFVNGLKDEVCKECGGKLFAWEEYAVKLGKSVGPLKPKKSGAVNNEFFKLEAFRNMGNGRYFIEPKYDGIWMEMHKKDGKVIGLFSDEGNNYADKFPGIVKEAEYLSADNFVIAGEMTRWRGGKRLTHEDVSAWVHGKHDGEINDKEFKYKPFDMMMSSGEDITMKALEDRRVEMDKRIKFGKQIHPTAKVIVNHKKGEGRLIFAIKDRKTREGAMVKDVEGRYSKEDADMLWKWKRQYELDCKVTEVDKKAGGGNVYSCAIGRGKDEQSIGDTFATSIEANKGDIITVSVDYVRRNKEPGKEDRYSWFAPKVIAKRTDKKIPDPLSTVKKIAEEWTPADGAKNMIELGSVLPLLKSLTLTKPIWLVGGIVEQGKSEHDIDILSREDLTTEEKNFVNLKLGLFAENIEYITDASGPAGPSILVEYDMSAESLAKWKYSNKFVLQEHGWGKKVHYDIRFGAPKTERMWGWTCFSKPDVEAGGRKTRCIEKKYHEPKWMDIDKKEIKPGEEGNPTKNLTAWMIKIDEGTYEYIRRKPGFLEMVLHGKKYEGRYIWREIEIKEKKSANIIEENKVDGDEVGTKNEKIWLMWKPKEQGLKKPIKKLNYKISEGILFYWESSENDVGLEMEGEE